MTTLIRWILPVALSFILGYFTIAKVLSILDRAGRTETAETALVAEQVARQVEKDNLEETLRVVQENADKADQRREHWRQSYYKTQREYDEYTKKWGPNSYPDELD